MTRLSILLLCALLAASCRNNANNVVLASLDRTDQLSLLCGQVLQTTGNLYQFYGTLPLALCDQDDVTFEVDGLAPDEPQPDAPPQFLGSVTQTQSGTVPVVNFSNGANFHTRLPVPGSSPPPFRFPRSMRATPTCRASAPRASRRSRPAR